MDVFVQSDDGVIATVAGVLASMIPTTRAPTRQEVTALTDFLAELADCPKKAREMVAAALKGRSRNTPSPYAIALLRMALRSESRQAFVLKLCSIVNALSLLDNERVQALRTAALLMGLSWSEFDALVAQVRTQVPRKIT